MILLPLHIAIALASLVVATLAFFAPSRAKLQVSYGLVAATLATGVYLVTTHPAHMVSACTSGLIYVGVVVAAIAATQHKLAHR